MNTDAPGPFFGFSLQFPRVLFYLLKSNEGDRVCVEYLGDISREDSAGNWTSEELKASLVKNPTADRSTNLWKTFYNWINDIQNERLDIDKTQFILHSNFAGHSRVAHAFSAASSMPEVDDAICEAKKKLSDIDHNHAIWQYYDYCMNQQEDSFKDLLLRFKFEIGSGTCLDEVHRELKSKFIPNGQITFVMEQMLGWLYGTIIRKLKMHEAAEVTWEEFRAKFESILGRVRRRELIDFAKETRLSEIEIQESLDQRPLFVRQLDAINASDDNIFEAVADFIKADINRAQWIENEYIDEENALDFEEHLKRFWSNKRSEIEIVHSGRNETQRGQLLLYECQSRQQQIDDRAPPPSTVSGTYHALANEPSIGWHPRWEDVCVDKQGEID